MAYITLAGKRDTDATEEVNKKLLSDTDYNRIAVWAAHEYFPSGVLVPGTPAVLDAEGVEVTPAVADSYRAPTGAEVFAAMTETIFDEKRRAAEAWYLAQAEAAARASVAPIVLTAV